MRTKAQAEYPAAADVPLTCDGFAISFRPPPPTVKATTATTTMPASNIASSSLQEAQEARSFFSNAWMGGFPGRS